MYVGQQPVVGRYILLDQISGGFNGTATGFTMTAGGQGVIPGLAQNVLLSLGGVIQQPGVDYLVSGSGLTFTTAPVSGTTFFATVLGDAQAVGTPSDGTVIPASIASSGTFVFPNVTVSGVTTIASGSAAAPSLSISGDANTGLYSAGADQLSIATSGTARLSIDGSGNINILQENAGPTYPEQRLKWSNDSTTANGFYISQGTDRNGKIWHEQGLDIQFATSNTERMRLDSSGRLGIGTSAPQVLTHLSTSTDTQLRVESTSASGTNEAALQLIRGSNQSAIKNKAGGIEFFVQGLTNEIARFDSSGRLGIGTTSPSVPLHVQNSGTGAITTGMWIGDSSTNGNLLIFRTGTGESRIQASWQNVGVDSNLTFYTTTAAGASGERARIDASGRLLVGTSTNSGGALLQVNGDRIRVGTAKTPASATDTGTAGEICWDANYVYVCTATNTWKRAALSTW